MKGVGIMWILDKIVSLWWNRYMPQRFWIVSLHPGVFMRRDINAITIVDALGHDTLDTYHFDSKMWSFENKPVPIVHKETLYVCPPRKNKSRKETTA